MFATDDTAESGEAKPTFTEKPVIRQSEDGKKVIFEVRFIADPKPTIKWMHKGKRVVEDARHISKLITDKTHHTAILEIVEAVADDGGKYELVATNSGGENTASLNLNIAGGKPQVPQGTAPRFPNR